MATSIEQIFRSYVVTKFREIQEQQYGGGKVGSQQNGEINSSEQVSPSDDEIVTIGSLQNDPLVQKIEQVLSEVLGTETQYKPDDGEDTAKSKSHSTKRGLSDEVEADVEVEVPRKKSKKDKKHKDKKKKKKRKKEKKYKKQSKESKLNDEHKEFGDSVPDSKAENLNSFLSSEDVDMGSMSPLKQGSEWFMEKNSCENLNSTMSNSCDDAFSSENSKLDTSEEDSVSINIQELSEIKLTNEKENEQHTDLALHPYSEDESLNTVAAESGVCMDRDEVASTAEIKPPETSSGSKAEEKVTASENSPESTGHEVEHLGTSLEPGTVEIADLNASRNLEVLHPETIQQSVPILADKSDCKFMKLPLETVVEAKDSVTTLGFLAMVVGKDFEATSEFLNTAKVKAAERSPKDNAFIDRKDPSSEKDSDGTVIVTEKRLLEETSEPLRAVSEDDFEPSLGHKHQRKVWKRFPESDARKRTEATLYPEALKETQASAITMKFKKPSPSLLILNKMDSGKPLSDPTAEVKNLKAASVFKEMDTRCLKAKSESENLQTVPHTLRKEDVRNQDRSPEFEKKIQWSYLEKPLETVMEERKSYAVAKDTETVAKLKASERFSRSGTAPEINDIKTTPGTPVILKTQYREVSKYAGETDVESETLTKQKGLEKLPESLLMVKNVQSISESQYVKEIKNMNNVLQSEVVAQRKDSEISVALEEKDSDATSGSLHMIFTNYSEPSLENDTESEAMVELKTLESVPELPSMVDANKSKELHAKEIKDLKSVESEAIIKLNDLENKLKSLRRDVKNLEMPTVINFQTLVASEATAQRKSNETVSHSVSEIEKVSDTIKYMEKDQTVAEAAGFKILPERQKMTENEPSAKTESLLFSKSLEEKDVLSSEATPELGAIAMVQKLKEAVDFTAGLDVGTPKKSFVLETTVSPDSQESSTTVNIAKDFESVSECHAEQSPTPFQTVEDNKTKGTEVILDSLYDLQVKYPVRSSEFLLSSELGSLGKKQKLKERAETAGSTAAPEPQRGSQRDQIIVPESDEFNKVVNTAHGPESSYLAKTNSENVLKSLYMVEAKDSKSHLGSTFIDVKDVEMESETTLKEGVEIAGNLPECKSVVAPEILEITSASPKKIEMLLKPQCPPVLHTSNAAFAITDLEANSETIHIINIENLEASSECEESEVVKTAEIVPTSLFAIEMMDSVATSTSGHIVEDKESKAIKKVVNLKASRDSTDILEETFEPTCITNVKETNRNLETNLDYLTKEEINNSYTKTAHEMDASGSQTIQRFMPAVDIHISEGLLTAVDNMVKKNSGTDLKPETQSVVRYSESVCQLENTLEREDYDTAMVLMEIKDSGASSSFLDTRKTTPQLQTISQHLCEFKSRDSADAGEAVSTSETKGLGRALNSTELEVQHAVASGTHLNTSELKSSDSVLEVTAPTYAGAAKVFQSPGTTTQSQSSETGTEYVLKAYDYNAASESESGMVKVSDNVEIVATSRDAQEIKGMKSPQSLSTMEVRDLGKSVIFEEVPDVSETSQQFSGNAEIKVLKVITPSRITESVKDSEKQLKLQLHLKEKRSDTLEPGYSTLYSEPKNSEANSGFIGPVDLKDTERPVKSPHAVESVHSKAAKDFLATPKSGTVGEINVLQVQTSARKEQGLDLEGISKSTVTLERHDLERNLLSVMVSEEKTPEGSLESSHGVKAKDSEVLLKCKNGKDVDVLEQNMAEMKNLESAPEWDALSQAKTPEIIPKITSEVKDSEAISEPLCMTEEKDLGETPQISLEEQVLKATLKPVCTGAESNLQANQQLTVDLKDSQAAAETVCMAEKMNLDVGKLVTVEVKGSETSLESVHTAKEKDLEGTADVSLKDQDSQATPQTSKEKSEGSILKDKKSEKVSSKSKDKSKSGKRAKKSRSKSPSKSKKRKKKSRSHSTSRRVTSRRGRSRSRDDSDSRKKHSSSHHKSRSKSVDKKDKESSLRSRRRRSRTSDRHKSRSRSVEKIKSRWRRSRSSDHRKSRSRSVDKSTRRKLRLSRSSEKHKSRSKSVDRMETRSRRRRSRSSDHRKSRSQSVDKRDTSVRTRRRKSRSSDRSRSVDKRDTSARRRRRRSRTSDNFKSRSKSLDRRESSIRSRRRRSRSSDRRKSRSRSVDDKRDTSLRTRRKRSRSLDNRKSRSRSADKETSVRMRRRRSRSSDNRRSKSKSVDKRESSVRTRRKRSRSLDNRKSRSKSVDKRDSSVRARRRRSRSSDNRKSRSRSADKREASVRTRRKRSRSSDNHKSRSRSLNKGDTSVRARRKRSRSSDHLKSRSRSVDKRETSVRTRRRRSRSSDTHKSRSKSVDKREASVKTRQRRSRSLDKRKSRSKSPDKRDTSVRTKRRQSHSSDTRKSRSKSLDKKETSAKSNRKRSRSCDSQKSRSKSVDKTETLTRSKRQRSQSPDQKSRTKPDEKDESSLMPKSSDRQRSKSKSRSKSSDRRQDKDSSDSLREKHSKSKSPEKTEGTESLETPVCNRTKSPEHQKSKSRSRSKSLDKTKRERSRRSKSKGSKSPELKTRKHGTDSRSRRNRSRSLTRKRTSRSKSDNRSRTRSRTRSRSCTRRWRRTRSRSVSRQRSLSKDRRRRSRRNRSRSTERRRRRSDSRDSFRVSLRLRSRSRTPARLRCSTGRRRSASKSPDHRRSRTSSRSPKRLTELDKAQLLEIAKANAAAMCAKAGVPLPPSLMPALAPEKKEEKVVQKTAKETIMELTEKCKKIAQSQEDDVILNKPHVSDEEEEENPFINHPFKLNEPKPIFFNLGTPSIKPAPPKNQVTLTKEFPVSSGSQHRKKEADSAYGEWVPVEKNKDEKTDDVFPNPASLEPVDISSALTERTLAQKRLTENTFDLEAMCLLNRAQERIDAWAQLNSLPGQFTGSTGAQVLTSEQLSNSGPQAWIKKDQFLRAAPVSGGMGAQLMRKMGWREGEGLGKNKEGNREPILVDFKTDRKGLVAVGEKTKRHGLFSAVKDLSGKHPVSLLVEACNKRRWSPPVFVLVHDNGPEHRKHFVFKVMVNGVEHKPTNPSPNKKHAKAAAATVALQALGILPKELMANATSFRSASRI